MPKSNPGIGIDMVELERFKQALEHEGFKIKVFTRAEITDCEAKRDSLQSFAVRFAIKEAFYKALGDANLKSVPWTQIETTMTEAGPLLRLSLTLQGKLGDRTPFISLTHTEHTAAAVVMLLPSHATLPIEEIIKDGNS